MEIDYRGVKASFGQFWHPDMHNEYSCSPVRVFLSILTQLAHLAHLAQSFFSDLKWDE